MVWVLQRLKMFHCQIKLIDWYQLQLCRDISNMFIRTTHVWGFTKWWLIWLFFRNNTLTHNTKKLKWNKWGYDDSLKTFFLSSSYESFCVEAAAVLQVNSKLYQNCSTIFCKMWINEWSWEQSKNLYVGWFWKPQVTFTLMLTFVHLCEVKTGHETHCNLLHGSGV